MAFGPVETPNLKDLATFVPAIMNAEPALQNHLRSMANFPLLEEGEELPDASGGPPPGMTGVEP
jgi:hypothetical protein